MARKSKSNDKGGGIALLIMVVLATVLIFLSVLYGLVALVAWLIYSDRYRRLPKTNSSKSFIATREESRQLAALEKNLADEKRLLRELQFEGNGLKTRADGAYDERSPLGRNLNPQIDQANRAIRNGQEQEDRIRDLRHQRFNHYVDAKVSAFAWKWSAFTYLLLGTFLTFVPPASIQGLSEFVNERGWPGEIAGIPNLWGALVAAAAIAVMSFFLSRWALRKCTHSELDSGPEPERIEAIRFTELLAAHTGIGDIDPADAERIERRVQEMASLVIESSTEEGIAGKQTDGSTPPGHQVGPTKSPRWPALLTGSAVIVLVALLWIPEETPSGVACNAAVSIDSAKVEIIKQLSRDGRNTSLPADHLPEIHLSALEETGNDGRISTCHGTLSMSIAGLIEYLGSPPAVVPEALRKMTNGSSQGTMAIDITYSVIKGDGESLLIERVGGLEQLSDLLEARGKLEAEHAHVDADLETESVPETDEPANATQTSEPTEPALSADSKDDEAFQLVKLLSFDCGVYCHLEYRTVKGETESALCNRPSLCNQWADGTRQFSTDSQRITNIQLITSIDFVIKEVVEIRLD